MLNIIENIIDDMIDVTKCNQIKICKVATVLLLYREVYYHIVGLFSKDHKINLGGLKMINGVTIKHNQPFQSGSFSPD